jgi:hypothetical protein
MRAFQEVGSDPAFEKGGIVPDTFFRPQRNVPATGVSSDVVGHLST